MDEESVGYVREEEIRMETSLEWVYESELPWIKLVELTLLESKNYCEDVQNVVLDKFSSFLLRVVGNIKNFQEFFDVFEILEQFKFSKKLKKKLDNFLQGKIFEILSEEQGYWDGFDGVEKYAETFRVFKRLFSFDFDCSDFFENFLIKFTIFIESFQVSAEVLAPLILEILELPLSSYAFQEIFKFAHISPDPNFILDDLIIIPNEVSAVKVFKSLKLHHYQGFLSNSQKISIYKYNSPTQFKDFKEVNTEINLMKYLENFSNFEYHAKVLKSFYLKNEIWLIQEHFDESLKTFIESKTKVSEKFILAIPDLIRNFSFLNTIKIFHGRLTPESIFITNEFKFKLNLVASIVGRACERNLYSAVWVNDIPNESLLMISDVFSLGLIFLEVFTQYKVEKDPLFLLTQEYLNTFHGLPWIKTLIYAMLDNKLSPNRTFSDLLLIIPADKTLLDG